MKPWPYSCDVIVTSTDDGCFLNEKSPKGNSVSRQVLCILYSNASIFSLILCPDTECMLYMLAYNIQVFIVLRWAQGPSWPSSVILRWAQWPSWTSSYCNCTTFYITFICIKSRCKIYKHIWRQIVSLKLVCKPFVQTFCFSH